MTDSKPVGKGSNPLAFVLAFLKQECFLFIGLKLTVYINCGWWWVLAPRWIPIILGATVATIMEMNERDKHE